MGILIGGALILMIITMGILFSYVRHRFMPVLLVAIGLVTSLGLMGLAGIQPEHGGDRGLPGPDRSWDRLCDPVPCPV